MSRYYPGFLAAFFIILLRIAIGWHFLYEGCEKAQGTWSGKEPFSAEIYLRNATGPLGPYFRGMLPDVNSLALLDPVRLKDRWKDDVSSIGDAYAFTNEQRSDAQKALDKSLQWADYWFDDPENVEKINKYYHDLGHVMATEQDLNALSFQKERAWEARRSIEADRRSLIAPLVAQEKALREAIAKLATPEQVTAANSTRESLQALSGESWRRHGFAGAGAVFHNSASSVDEPRRSQRPDDVWLDRDRRMSNPGFIDAALGPVGSRLPGDDLLFDASVARFAAQSQGRGPLPDREQKPGRADRLPGDRHHAQRTLDRPGCLVLRRKAPAPAGGNDRCRARSWQ